MKALSLYSGGCDGLSLSGSWVGIETVAFCESDPACRRVLAARHPGKPIFESDEEVTADALRAAGVDPRGIDIVMGGPPCQCVSIAGKRLGDRDPRNRWPQALRIVREIRPRWCFFENSPELCTANSGRLFGNILRSLAQSGYDAAWRCWGACDVGAPHGRQRVFIMGYTERGGCGREPWRGSGQELADGYLGIEAELADAEGQRRGETRADIGRSAQWIASSGDVADAGGKRLPRADESGQQTDQTQDTAGAHTGLAGRSGMGIVNPCAPQPRLGRNPDGLLTGLDEVTAYIDAWPWPAGKGPEQYDWEPPRVAASGKNRAERSERVARLRMIGNSCPPQQYLVGLTAIAEADRRMHYE